MKNKLCCFFVVILFLFLGCFGKTSGTPLKGEELQGFLNSQLSLRPGILDGGATIGALFYNENRSSEIEVDEPELFDGSIVVTLTTMDRIFDFYFLYDRNGEASYLEEIEVTYLDRNNKTDVIDEFGQKSMIIMMLAPILVGN